jgi:hypothetical protein
VATVGRDGRFELHALPLAHRPPLCEADLDIGAVFEGPVTVPPLKTEIDPDLPAIFGVSPFPFLLPLAGRVDFWTKGADGFFYGVLNDRRLVRFRDQRSGARVLASDIPGGRTIWMDADGSEVHAVKLGSNQRPARLLSVSLPYGQLRVTDLASGPELQAVHRYGDAIVTIRSHDARAYSLADGRLLDQARNLYRHRNGRYLFGEKGFHFAVWDGTRVKFEPVSMPIKYLASSVAIIFDREGLPGPWLLLRSGEVISTETDEVIKLPSLPTVKLESIKLQMILPRISRDGHKLLVLSDKKSPTNKPLACLFGLEKPLTMELVPPAGFILDRNPPLPTGNVFRIIEWLARCPEGIMLCGRKNRWRKLGLDTGGKLRITSTGETSGVIAEFAEHPRKTRHGCALQLAKFPNGSKVFLDSRGLLHFKSSDPALPEVSVVLANGEVAGWTSDGCVCGPSFFFDGPHTSDPKGVFERIMRFFDRL